MGNHSAPTVAQVRHDDGLNQDDGLGDGRRSKVAIRWEVERSGLAEELQYVG